MKFTLKQETSLWLIIVLVIFNILNIVELGIIYKRNSSFKENPPEKDRIFMRDLRLTNEQKEKFHDLHHEYFTKNKKYIKKMKLTKQKILQELFKEEPNLEKLNNLTKKTGEHTINLEQLRYQEVLKMKKILNKKQIRKFKHIINNSYKNHFPPNRIHRRNRHKRVR